MKEVRDLTTVISFVIIVKHELSYLILRDLHSVHTTTLPLSGQHENYIMTKHFCLTENYTFYLNIIKNNLISSEHAWLPHSPVVFITTLNHRRGPHGELTSKTMAVNYGGTFNPTSGVFQAPETGFYLFLVALDFERGISLAVLKRSGVPVASLRQEQGEKRGPVSRASLLELRQGETVTLELMHGSLRKSQLGDNTLSGLLLFITEHKDML